MFPGSLQQLSASKAQLEMKKADNQMGELSVCSPPVYHQLHDNLHAMTTESRGPLCRSNGGPHTKHTASHHIHAHAGMYNHTNTIKTQEQQKA